ncbi:MAG: hypothetical protein ACXWLM_12455, partial [Myxococcales bacterium]
MNARTMLVAAALAAAGCGSQKQIYGTLEIDNQSGYTVSQFFLAPSNQTNWGPNQLSTPLASGSKLTLTRVLIGKWDAKASFAEAIPDQFLFGLEIVGGQNFKVTVSKPTLLQVTNATSQAIVEMHLSPQGQSSFGNNLLSSPIAAGTTVQLSGLTAGAYDIKFVFADGGSAVVSATIAQGEVTPINVAALGT